MARKALKAFAKKYPYYKSPIDLLFIVIKSEYKWKCLLFYKDGKGALKKEVEYWEEGVLEEVEEKMLIGLKILNLAYRVQGYIPFGKTRLAVYIDIDLSLQKKYRI